jgi:hypothetical protein
MNDNEYDANNKQHPRDLARYRGDPRCTQKASDEPDNQKN